MGAFHAMKDHIREVRPELLCRHTDGDRCRSLLHATIADQVQIEMMKAYAAEHGVASLTCGYASDEEQDEGGADSDVEPAPAASQPSVGGGQTQMCTKCKRELPLASYSKTQWKKSDGTRRCKACVAIDSN